MSKVTFNIKTKKNVILGAQPTVEDNEPVKQVISSSAELTQRKRPPSPPPLVIPVPSSTSSASSFERNVEDKSSSQAEQPKPPKRPLLLRKVTPVDDTVPSIPINKFGEAMLRGMGWVPSKTEEPASGVPIPQSRPERLGLGAHLGPQFDLGDAVLYKSTVGKVTHVAPELLTLKIRAHPGSLIVPRSDCTAVDFSQASQAVLDEIDFLA
jgi:hypothetical protein